MRIYIYVQCICICVYILIYIFMPTCLFTCILESFIMPLSTSLFFSAATQNFLVQLYYYLFNQSLIGSIWIAYWQHNRNDAAVNIFMFIPLCTCVRKPLASYKINFLLKFLSNSYSHSYLNFDILYTLHFCFLCKSQMASWWFGPSAGSVGPVATTVPIMGLNCHPHREVRELNMKNIYSTQFGALTVNS